MLKQRVVTALVLLAALAAALWFGRLTFVFAMALVFVAAVFEWMRLAGLPRGACVAASLALVGALLALELLGKTPIGGILTLFAGGACAVWLTLATVLVQAERRGVNIGLRGSAVLGVAVLTSAWFALLYLHGRGVTMLLSALAVVWVADIAAYFAGRAFGRTRLAPRISPGKTWAGAGGAVVGVLALAAIAWMGWPEALLFTNRVFMASAVIAPFLLTLLVALSIVGDLFESLLKRQAGMKDSGSLLPGHGGVLDRIDALLPVLPAAVLIERWIR